MFQLITTVFAVLMIALDQMSKNWAAEVLTKGEIPLIQNALYLRYTENTGVAFSMFSDNRWILVGITAVMIVAVLAFFLSGKVTDKLELFSLSLILAGGVGNLIDRISLGYVIDFIDVRLIHFAIFNVADMCITVGAVLLCLAVLIDDKRQKEDKKKKMEAFDEIDKDLEMLFQKDSDHE